MTCLISQQNDTFFPPGIVVYRLPWTWKCSKQMMKLIHAGLHVLAFILAVISVVAVFDFHNTKDIPNMYSLHSWLGLTAVILYPTQVKFTVCNTYTHGPFSYSIFFIFLNFRYNPILCCIQFHFHGHFPPFLNSTG